MKKQKVAVVNGVIVCEYPSIGKIARFPIAEYPESILRDAMEHGFEQKFGDAKSGRPAEEKYAEVLLIHESLMSGEWNRTATRDMTMEILEAVADLQKVKLEPETKTLIQPKTGKRYTPDEAKVKEWAANAEVKVKIRERQLAKAKAIVEATPKDERKLEVEFK